MMGLIRNRHTRIYDLVWSGVTKINNIEYQFRTKDLTDYDTMNDTCRYCSQDKHIEELLKYCHCENYKEIICILEKV